MQPPLQHNIWDTVTNPGLLVSAGANTGSLSAVTFSNSNGVSFGLNAGVITASMSGGTGAAGSLTVSDSATSLAVSILAFTNSNGLTQTLSTAPGAATVIGSYTVPVVTNSSWTVSDSATSATVGRLAFVNGNGVTFALSTSNNGQQSVSGSVFTNYAGTGFTSATTAGTVIVGTLNNNGLSVGVPAYITTYSNDLTSGRAGTGFTSATTAGTNVVGTLDTNGLSVGVPAYITTYVNDLTSGRAGTGFTSTTTAGTAIVATLNTSGLSMGIPGYLTAATAGATSWTVSDSVASATVGRLAFVNSNGVSFGLSTSNNGQQTVTATVNTNYLTNIVLYDSVSSLVTSYISLANSNGVTFGLDTVNSRYTASIANTYAGTGFTTATTTGTNIVGTLNTSGLSMGVPAYLTAASGGGGVAISNSQTLFSSGTVALSEGGGAITIASSAGGQSLMFSVPQTSSLVGTSGISISTSGSTISIYQSGINGVGVSNTGNTAGNVGYLTNSNYALAGSGSITLSQSTAAGAATCWIQHPAWITTATQSSWTVSDSATSATVGRLAFVNSNGVSFGLSTSNNGLQSVSASIATTYAGTGFTSATTAGVAIVGTLNTSGLSLGVPAMLTTAALSSAHMSYFENMPILEPGSTTLSASGSVLQVLPFVLPHNISIGFLRVPVSMSYVSTEVSGTTANSTWSVNVSYTDAAVIMTQKGGASSLSLGYFTSSSCSWVFQNQIQAAAQGSRYTVTQNVTYPISGTTSNYTTSYPQSSANVQISSASLTLFTGPRWLDIPMGISLSAGNYWLALGRSTNSATQAGNAALGAASAGFSYIGVSQNNVTICFPGAVTNSSCQLQPGLGSWSTNAAVMSTSSIGLGSVSAMSSGPKPYFQMIRYA